MRWTEQVGYFLQRKGVDQEFDIDKVDTSTKEANSCRIPPSTIFMPFFLYDRIAIHVLWLQGSRYVNSWQGRVPWWYRHAKAPRETNRDVSETYKENWPLTYFKGEELWNMLIESYSCGAGYSPNEVRCILSSSLRNTESPSGMFWVSVE
jgi:hypothetical protein